MKRRTIFLSVIILVSIAEATAQKKILIYGPSITPAITPNEQTLATGAGNVVTVVDAATWSSLTTTDFMNFDAIVFGDPNCVADPSPLTTANANKSVWSAAITGPKILIGTDPVFHRFQGQAQQLIVNGIKFAASGPGTGLYASLSCYFFNHSAPATVDFLSGIDSFQVLGQAGCPNSASIVASSHPAMAGLINSGLSNWSCSMHEWFSSFPSSYTVLVAETSGTPASRPYVIATTGRSCQANVTRLSQGDTRWGNDHYDTSKPPSTISELGCALTSLSMALNFSGVANDPRSLNSFMSRTDTDYSGLFVWWDHATRDATGPLSPFSPPKKFRFDTLGGSMDSRNDSISNPTGAFKQLNDALCASQPQPVIVGVRGIKNCVPVGSFPGHYVLVTARQIDGTGKVKYLIADPGCSSNTSLDAYNNEFVTRGTVTDPPGDISQLDLTVGDVGELLVVDPTGKRTGFDPLSGMTLQDISGSAYFTERLDNDITGETAAETTHILQIFQPSEGIYRIIVTGLKAGTYTLAIGPFSQDGSAQPTALVPGIAGAGSTSSFSAHFSSSPGAIPRVIRVASFQSTLEDIHNSLRLGLIDNEGIANSLSSKIEAAAAAATRGEIQASRNILVAFEHAVSAQTGKHIKDVVSEVLLQDAASLLSQ